MTNLAIIIDDLKRQYVKLQIEYKVQLEYLIEINDDIRNENKQIAFKNEQLKLENLRLKAENKQILGDLKMSIADLDTMYGQSHANPIELESNFVRLKQDMAKYLISNRALNKQLYHANETIKHLQKVNSNYRHMNSLHEYVEINIQPVNGDDTKPTEEWQRELNKLKDENNQLIGRIQLLKKGVNDSESVQEDLIRLIQSLQIELNYYKQSTDANAASAASNWEVRLLNEDCFTQCGICRVEFSGKMSEKNRCSHCCKIFCANCCSKTVNSGPNRTPYKVCNTCHILLDKDMAVSMSGLNTANSFVT